MTLRRILRGQLLGIGLLIFSTGLAQEKAKYPSYYKSNPSKRYITVNSTSAPAMQKITNDPFQASIPDTLKVMALRVQFQRDNDRNTTGDGWFDFTVGEAMINPPPHNQQYFSNQLRALRDYYYKV